MIICNIHIENECNYIDKDVFVTISLPCLPPIGSTIYLGEELIGKLYKQAEKSVDIKMRYIGEHHYKRDEFEAAEAEGTLTVEDIGNLNFEDCIFVYAISFTPNSEIINIELSNSKPTNNH